MTTPTRPEITTDVHMVGLLVEALIKLIDIEEVRNEIPQSKFLTTTYLMLVAQGRIRTGCDDYELLQDIAQGQLSDVIREADRKYAEEVGQ